MDSVATFQKNRSREIIMRLVVGLVVLELLIITVGQGNDVVLFTKITDFLNLTRLDEPLAQYLFHDVNRNRRIAGVVGASDG